MLGDERINILPQMACSFSLPGKPLRDCPVCGDSTRFVQLGHLRDVNHCGEYDLLQCVSCELIFLSPLPEQVVFEEIYLKNKQFDDQIYRGERVRSINEFYLTRIEALLHEIEMVGRPIRILEIGSGLSWLSYAAKSLCAQSLTIAQDISSEVVQECTWVDRYLVGDLFLLIPQLRSYGPFDVISMTHVIEHLPNPVAVLHLCQSLLHPDGIVFVTAPHRPVGWSEQEPFRTWSEWSYNHVPAHLQYFNSPSLHRCAEKASLSVEFFSIECEQGQSFEAWLRHQV